MPEYQTLVGSLERSREKFADNPLFGVKKHGEYEWMTYAEFGKLVDEVRGGLADLGVGEGDTVAIIADNGPNWAACAYASYGRGAVFCPMYTAQRTKDWRYIIDNSDARLVFCADQEVYDEISPLVDELDELEFVVPFEGEATEGTHFDELREVGRNNPVEPIKPDKDALGMFIYTSGTTGDPKGVRLSHWNVCSNILAVESMFPIGPNDTSLAFLPWAHSFGQTCELHMLIAKGASIGLVEDVSTIIENLGEVKPTLLFSVPRIFNKIYKGVKSKMAKEGGFKKTLFDAAMANAERIKEADEQGRTPNWWVRLKDWFFDRLIFRKIRDRFGGRLRFAFSGGAALSPEVAQFIDALHIKVYEGYGLTETSPISAVNAPGARKIGSVGQPIPNVDIEIEQVPEYEEGTGEVCVKGPNVMMGYHKLPEVTAQVLDEDGKFHTGDLGTLDDDGYLWILGRVKSQYKLQNGKYVVPGPVEEQLKLSPFVNQIMIEGTNKPYNVAVIVPDFEALRDWLAESNVDAESETIDELMEHEAVQKLYEEELSRWSEPLKGYEEPRDFVLVEDEFTTDNGMLTPTLKLKRRNIMKAYEGDIEALYREDEVAAQ